MNVICYAHDVESFGFCFAALALKEKFSLRIVSDDLFLGIKLTIGKFCMHLGQCQYIDETIERLKLSESSPETIPLSKKLFLATLFSVLLTLYLLLFKLFW